MLLLRRLLCLTGACLLTLRRTSNPSAIQEISSFAVEIKYKLKSFGNIFKSSCIFMIFQKLASQEHYGRHEHKENP